jgi:hypothetical protein
MSRDRILRLQDLCGFWRRNMIAWPDGRRDTTTEVWWLQGPHDYADLRIPAGRPAHGGIACLRDLDRTMLAFMARQEGFFGTLGVVQSIGEWTRAFDYQPDTGLPDRGALSFDRGTLVERGIEVPYVEHWRRASDADAVMSVRLRGAAPPCLGCIVAAGDAFIYARGRSAALPAGAGLTQLIAQSRSREAAQDLFDCEISFGRRRGAAWRIERSSLCFREGASLAPFVDDRANALLIDDVSPSGSVVRRQWQIDDFACTGRVPLRQWLDSDFHPNSIAQVSAR